MQQQKATTVMSHVLNLIVQITTREHPWEAMLNKWLGKYSDNDTQGTQKIG